MNDTHRSPQFPHQERTLVERILYALLGVTILVLAFFFLTVALIAGALLAAIIAVRWWWLSRKLRKTAHHGTIEGEYTIVEHPPNTRNTLPPDR